MQASVRNAGKASKLAIILFGFIGLTITSVFQNCDRPYNLELEDPKEENSSLTLPVTVNQGNPLTNSPDIAVSVEKKYAQEMNISFDPNCSSGQWEPYNQETIKEWTGGDGMVAVYVKFRNFRKEETPCYSSEVMVDSTPPKLEFSNKVNEITKDKTAGFEIKVDEGLSGTESVQCRLLTSNVMASSSESDMPDFEDCPTKLDIENLKDDKYELQIQARDVAGNVSETLRHTWIVDSTVPELRVQASPQKFLNSGASVTYQFDSNGDEDKGSGIDKYLCSVGGATAIACTSPYTLKNLKDGLYNVVIQAVDKAENKSEYKNSFTVDTVKPKVAFSSQMAALTNSKSAKIDFKAEDELSGVQTVSCALDNATATNCNNQTSHTYNNLADGNHEVRVVTSDKAGNVSNHITMKWRVDATRPEIEINETSLPARYTRTASANFKYKITDPNNGSGIGSVTCQISGADEKNCSATAQNYWGLADGNHRFDLRVLDKAGNPRNYTYQWTVDRTRPEIEILVSPDNGTTNKTAIFKYNIIETGSGIETVTCKLDNNDEKPCGRTGIQYWIPEAGWHRFYLNVTDKAGNKRTYYRGWTLKN